MLPKKYNRIVLTCLVFISGVMVVFGNNVDSLFKQLKTVRSDTSKALILLELSRYYSINNSTLALDYANQAFVLSNKTDFTKGKSRAYNVRGILYRNLGNSAEALNNFYAHHKLIEKQNDSLKIAVSLLNLGAVYSDIGNDKRALEFFLQVVNIALKQDKVPMLIQGFINAGAIYKKFNQYDLSLKYLHKASDVAAKVKDSLHLNYCYLNLSEVYSALNDKKKALYFLSEGLKLAEKRNDGLQIALFQTNTGVELFRQKRYNESLDYLHKGLRKSKEIKIKEFEKTAYEYLSHTYSKLKNDHLALRYNELFHRTKDSISSDLAKKKMLELEAAYQKEKMDQKLLLLSSQNEIQGLKISKRNFVIGGLFLLIVSILIIGFLLFRQIHLKNMRKSTILEQKALRAQINPHFLFNALNSIQKFIGRGDKENAHKYIGRFSSLMRQILDNSDDIMIPIEEELNAVKFYLEIEQLRIPGQFDFEINVSEEVDIMNTYMPSMIIQPYVENSIWHGLVHKKKNGRVIIRVDKNERDIILSIEDNGTGIPEHPELYYESEYKRPSGMKLVSDRINAINKIRDTKIRLLVNDLPNSDGNNSGTRIQICMPISTEK